MNNILRKEFVLSSSVIAYLFMLFGLMFLIPGYPILCGVFFSTLGLYKSFEYAREANDIVFSLLLPIGRRDVVKGKFGFVCFIESGTMFLMFLSMLLRMTLFRDTVVYRDNFMMNANPFALGAAFVLFGLFNLIFVEGFFKTVYKLGKPFIVYIFVVFICIGLFESLHHFPGLEVLNSFGVDNIVLQILLLVSGVFIWFLLTVVSYKKACRDFDKIDL